MKYFVLLIIFGLIFLSGPSNAETDTLKQFIRCGVSTDTPGFGSQQGTTFTGLEVEFCKAFATAITGSSNNARYVPTLSSNRFQLIANNTIDVITRGTFISLSRESLFNVRFSFPYYWDLGGIVVLASSPIQTQNDFQQYLNDTQKICVNQGSLSQEQALRFYGDQSTRTAPTPIDALNGVANKSCLGYINGVTLLSGVISGSPNPNLFRIVTLDSSTLDPYGFAVNKHRKRLHQTISWIVSGLILAYDQGITQNNVDTIDFRRLSPDAQRMLGYNTSDPSLPRNYDIPGSYLSPLSMTNIIKAVGNWGEIFNRTIANIGAPLARNLPISKGGLLVPYRW